MRPAPADGVDAFAGRGRFERRQIGGALSRTSTSARPLLPSIVPSSMNSQRVLVGGLGSTDSLLAILWIIEGPSAGQHGNLRDMDIGEPFIGSEALACGALTRHQLRTRYWPILPDVYLSRQVLPGLEQRISAAWLWSRGAAIIAGAAAAALHGAKWIPDNVPVELIHDNTHPPKGVLTQRVLVLNGEMQTIAGRAVTTPERTAFDIGRRGEVRSAVARLDALAAATGFKVDDVLNVAKCHPGSPGLRRLETALELVDGGAQSARESYLRLMLIDAGLPRPQTQIPVLDAGGVPIAYLDLGWTEYMVAVEYDGDHHRADRGQYVSDIKRLEMLERMGWIVIRVVAEHRRADILRRVREAIEASQARHRI